MRKFLIFNFSFLIVTLLFVGCGKQKENVDVKATFDEMYQRVDSAFEAAQTPDEQKQIITVFLDSVYTLIDENMGEPYTDTLFSMMYAGFSMEQMETLFDKMPSEMKESELINPIYETFLVQQKTSKGKPFIDFTAVTPDGQELSLSDLVGKTDYVLVDFWASWCGPCRRLIPVLKDIYASQPEGRLQIFSCSVDKDEAAWRNALEEEQMAWAQAREDADHECSDLYGARYIPYTVLIDREGHIVAVNPEEPELEQILFGE